MDRNLRPRCADGRTCATRTLFPYPTLFRSCDGGRWSHTPELGIFHTPTDAAGNAMIPEDRIKAALESSQDPRRLRAELALALGQAWDDELEPFRHAGAGAPVRWLHRVG